MMYFPLAPLDKPVAEPETLLSGIPGIDIVIGLSTPLYTTFILSAAITAAFGFDIVEKLLLTGTSVSSPSCLNIKLPSKV